MSHGVPPTLSQNLFCRTKLQHSKNPVEVDETVVSNPMSGSYRLLDQFFELISPQSSVEKGIVTLESFGIVVVHHRPQHIIKNRGKGIEPKVINELLDISELRSLISI